jgi:cation diffusion facilitator family transporter
MQDSQGTYQIVMASPTRRMALLSITAALVTMALKFTAWGLTGSVGLFSDAAESSVNLIAGITALTALIIAARYADAKHPYGHDKVEYFSSGMEGGLIMVAAGIIVYSAVARLLAPQPLEPLGPGLGIAVLAAAINFWVARSMLRVARAYDSITIEADAYHLLTDVWTSLAVVAGLLVVMFAPPAWQVLDSLIAIAVGVHITSTGIDLVRRSLDGLMDTALPAGDIVSIETAIQQLTDERAAFHGLRTRKVGRRRFIEFHLLLPGQTTVQDSHDLCERIEKEIAQRLDNTSVTIHVEPLEDPLSWDDPQAKAAEPPVDLQVPAKP